MAAKSVQPNYERCCHGTALPAQSPHAPLALAVTRVDAASGQCHAQYLCEVRVDDSAGCRVRHNHSTARGAGSRAANISHRANRTSVMIESACLDHTGRKRMDVRSKKADMFTQIENEQSRQKDADSCLDRKIASAFQQIHIRENLRSEKALM